MSGNPYFVKDGGIIRVVKQGKEYFEERLTNFTARITQDLIRDDGDHRTERFVWIEAEVEGRQTRFSLPISEFNRMTWPLEKLGPSAIVAAGVINDRRVRDAIQFLSHPIPLLVQFTHIGWECINGKYHYLHAAADIGQAIGSEFPGSLEDSTKSSTLPDFQKSLLDQDLCQAGRVGRVVHVEVTLDNGLQCVQLLPLGSDDDAATIVRSTLDVLRVGDLEVTAPAFCGVWRSILGPAQFSLGICGPSGSFKTAYATVIQQFFGPELNHLLGSWASTANSLEALLHDAKDLQVIIDDYAPQEMTTSHKLAAVAEQVLRVQGNSSGRGRSRSDGSRRPIKRPRGSVLLTGEEVPPGYSLQSRMLVSFCEAESIDGLKLRQVQDAAARGTYSKAMRLFTEHIALRMPAVQELLPNEVECYRQHFRQLRLHPRQVDALAHLAVGLNAFLQFAMGLNAISNAEADELWNEVCDALQQVARKQRRELCSTDQVERVRGLLRAALSMGLAHLCDERGNEPLNSAAVGWRFLPGVNGDGVCRPFGDRIGWVSGCDVFLEPQSCLRTVKRALAAGDEPLAISLRMLKKRMLKHLKENGLDARETYTVRRSLEGARREVLHVGFDFIFGDDADSAQDFARLIDI